MSQNANTDILFNLAVFETDCGFEWVFWKWDLLCETFGCCCYWMLFSGWVHFVLPRQHF